MAPNDMVIQVIALVEGFTSFKSLNLLFVFRMGDSSQTELSDTLGVEQGCHIGLDLILILSPSAHSRGFV